MKRKGPIEQFDVKSIKDPSFLRNLNHKSLLVLCHDLRKEIIESVSKTGGHLSSNLGDVEITVALHRAFDFTRDKLIFDVGHQCYTHKLLTGRSLATLHSKGGISGFQKRAESPYDVYEAGHSSTSLSAAQAFAIARDEKKENYDVVALIGDSSISNGLAMEALNNIGARNNKVIIVLNDNDMSISRPVGGFSTFFRRISTARGYNKFKRGFRRTLYRSRLGRKFYSFSLSVKNAIKAWLVPATFFDEFGFTYIGPVDGHDLKALEKALKRAKQATKSVVIHCITTKGKGYPLAEKDDIGYWHGVSPFDVKTGEPLKKHPGYISWSHYYADLTYEMLKNNEQTYLICAATLKGSGQEDAFSTFPGRTMDVGIAEEHALTFAGALALNGYHPIVNIYSTFLQRAYDEVSHDIARFGVDCTILVDRAGLTGKDGETHQGIYDCAFLKSIPGVTVTMPATKAMGKALYLESLNHHGAFAIRYPRSFVKIDDPSDGISAPYGKFRYLKQGNEKLAIIAVGPHCEELSAELEARNLDCGLIDPVYLNPVLKEEAEKLLGYQNLIIYDAYDTLQGFAETLESTLMELGYKGKVIVRAVPNEFIAQASIAEQEEDAGLSVKQIADLAAETLQNA